MDKKISIKYFNQLRTLFSNLNEEQIRMLNSARISKTYAMYKEYEEKIDHCNELSKKFGVSINILLEEYFCA